jgi:hypothetical protein
MKTCKTCKEEKPLTSFGQDKARSGNMVYKPYCKDCRAAKTRKEREANTVRTCTCCSSVYKVLGGGAKQNLKLCQSCYPTYRTAYSLWHACLSRAKSKGLDFDLDVNYLHQTIAKGVCAKTGQTFEIKAKGRNFKDRSPFTPSVDKIDPNKGYTKENVQIVCWWYNLAKSTFTDEEVLKLCKSVIAHNS